MKIISICTQKGGAGKTVVTALVANCLAIDYKKRLLVLDSDYQRSISDIRSRDIEDFEGNENAMPYEIRKLPATEVVTFLDTLNDDDYDVIMIDTPGRMDDVHLVRIIQELDGILIPLVADQTDLFSTIDFVEMLSTVLDKLKEIGVGDKKVFAFNNKSEGAIEEKGLQNYCENLGIPLFDNKITDKKLYSRFTTYTSYISEPGYKYNPVRDEVKLFMDELVEKLEL